MDPLQDSSQETAGGGAVELPDDQRVGGWMRGAILIGVLVAGMFLAHYLPIRAWLQDSTADRRMLLMKAGIWIYPASVGIVALLVACGVPRLLLCGIAGMVLGFWWGLAIVQIGSLIGYYAVFLFVRGWGRDWALRRWPKLRKWADIVHDHGTVGVILLRQLPIHGTFINLGLGLSHVKPRHFLLGTLIGSLPEAVPAALAGAGMVRGSLQATASYLGIAAIALAAIWLICGYLVRALKQTRAGSEVLAEVAGVKE